MGNPPVNIVIYLISIGTFYKIFVEILRIVFDFVNISNNHTVIAYG